MSTPSFRSEWGPLPSGRHRLSRDEVLASQRGRIIAAMAASVAEKGYGPVSVGEVVRRANVSRRTFYEHFPDKLACFLATFDTGVGYILERMNAAIEALPSDDWAARLRAGIGAYLDVLGEEPDFARALELESLAAGPEAMARRAEAVAVIAAGFQQLYDQARAEDRSLPTLPADVFLALTGGIDELIREHLRTDGAAALPGLLETTMRFVEASVFSPRGRHLSGA